MCSNKGYNFKTGIDQPYDVVYHIEDNLKELNKLYMSILKII